MYENGDVYWVNRIIDALVSYNNIKHVTIKLTPIDAKNNPEKVRYSFSFKNIKPKLKVGDYVKNADKGIFLSKRYTFNWNTELFEINQVLKTQLPIYRIEYVDGEKIEKKYYEQKLLKSDFDFESNNKVFETLGLTLTVKKKITRDRFN